MKPFGKVCWRSVSGAGSGFGGGREIGVSTPPELPPFVATEKSAELLPWKSLPAEKPLPPGAWAGPGCGAARGRACPCASKSAKAPNSGCLGQDGARCSPCRSWQNDGARCDVQTPQPAPRLRGDLRCSTWGRAQAKMQPLPLQGSDEPRCCRPPRLPGDGRRRQRR